MIPRPDPASVEAAAAVFRVLGQRLALTLYRDLARWPEGLPLEGLGVDHEEQLALPDHGPLVIVLRLEVPSHPGPDLHVLSAADLAGEFGLDRRVPDIHRLNHDLRRRRWGRRRLLAAGQPGNHEQCRQAPAFGHVHNAPIEPRPR